MSVQADRIISVRTTKTVYRSGDYAIKVFDPKYSASSVLSEAHNQTLAAENGIKAPAVRKIEKTDDLCWAIYSDYIPGKTLWQTMNESDNADDSLFEMFVDTQISLQENEISSLPSLYDITSRQLSDSPITSVKRYELQNVLENFPEYRKVCHFDFVPWNIIISELEHYGLSGSAGPYILDWPLACRGNSDADAAQTYLTLNVSGHRDLAERYIKVYAEKSGSYMRQLMRWIPILSACRLSRCRIEYSGNIGDILNYFINLDYNRL